MTIKPELIFYNHNFLKHHIEQSLIIVKEYIIKNELIIVGGMAIDLALKTVGLNIYDEHDIPDYDVYSYDNLFHSQELVKILCKQNIPDVSMMSAIHNTTIRVKMSGYTVFDCTYVPKNVYDQIPTISSLGFNIIDPNYQKIDQYNSLSFLFDITGVSYNIFHRMQKDIDRNNLLVDNFNVVQNKVLIKLSEKISIPLNWFKGEKFDIYDANGLVRKIININDVVDYISSDETYIETNHDFCLHGVAAYSFYYNEIKKMVKSKEEEELFKQCNIAEITIDKKNITFSMPKDMNIVLINNNIKFNESIKLKIKAKFNSMLDIFPIRVVYENNIEVYDLFGRLLSIKIGDIDGSKFIISNFTYLLSYFLAKYYFADDTSNRDIYLSYYYSMLNLIKIGNSLPIFKYTLSTFGEFNYSEPYFYFIKNIKHLYDTKQNSTEKPKASYLSYPDCNSNIEFDYENSEFFKIDGKQNDDMQHTNFSHLLK